MQTLRIFISSPGDVAEERDRARQVVEQLRRRYAGRLELKTILWEDLPLQADMSFQQGIDCILSRSGVDIAVFILWSRLGSPTGARILKDDGSEYLSGTEREFDLMLRARARSGGQRPDIIAYTRNDDASFDERLRGKPTAEKEKDIHQKKLVESFILEQFHDPESQTNLRAYHNFDRPATFSQRLRVHLQELLDARVDGVQADAVWDIARQGSPFLGLEAYQPRHAPVFFGREDEILEVRQALGRQACAGSAFVLIAGASGSGKSSLARAGVLPAIIENEIDDTISGWRSLMLTPGELGAEPLESFAQRLAEVLPALRADEPAWAAGIAADLRRDPELITRRVILPALALSDPRATPGKAGPRLLLLIDQLEELLSSPHWSEPDRLAFAALLEALARSGKVWVLATLRADFLGAIQDIPPLVRLRSGGGQTDLLPPDVAALRRLITEPARLAGLRFEERDGKSLADTILADAAGHRELLPLAGHLLADLFANRAAGDLLTFARYEAVGGVTGALARHADAAFTAPALDDEARAELGRVLRRLVTLSGDDETVFVRQYPALAGFSPAQRRLVDAFIQARLFTTKDDGSVTLAHEALLRAWLPARTWAEANAGFLRVRARVEARRKQGGLLLEGDPLLDLAKTHLADDSGEDGFTPEQRAWLQDSLQAISAARQRREKTRRRVLIGLSTLTTLSLLGGSLALWQWSEASTARRHAEAQTEIAEAEKKRAEEKVRESSRSDLHVGQRRLEQGKWSEALAYFARALSNDPGNRNAEDALLMSLLYGPRDDGLLPVAELPADRFATEYEFSPDGSHILAISSGVWIGEPEPPGSLQLWSAKDGSRIGPERKYDSFISKHKFSLDGRRLIITTGETEITLDTATGEIIQPSEEDIAKNGGVISPDGSKYCYGIGRLVVVADFSTGAVLHEWEHESPVVTVVWASDGGSVFTVSTRTTNEKPGGVVQRWSLDDGGTLGKAIPVETEVLNLQPSPDGKTLAMIDRDGDVRFWDTEVAAMRGQLRLEEASRAKNGAVESRDVVFNDDGSRAIVLTKMRTSEEDQNESGGRDWVQIYDPVNSHNVGPEFPKTHETPVQISDTGDMLLTVGDGTLTYRNLEDGEIIETKKMEDSIFSIIFSPDRKWAWVDLSGTDGRLINLAIDNNESFSLDCHAGNFNADGRRFVAVMRGSIQLWDLNSLSMLGEIPSLWGWTNVAFSPDGAQLLVTAFRARWYPVGGFLYQTNLGSFQPEFSIGAESLDAMKNPSIASQQVEPALGEQPNPEEQLAPEPGMHPKGKPVWRETSRDGRIVATLVAIENTVADDKPHTLALHLRDSTPESIDTNPLILDDGSDIDSKTFFNSDGSLIAVLGTKVHVIETATRNVACAISDELQGIGEMCFSPDGHRILTATTGGEGDRYNVQLWDAHSGHPLWDSILHSDPVTIYFAGQGDRIVTITHYPFHLTVTRIIDAATGLQIGPELRMFAEYSSSDFKVADDTVNFISEATEEDKHGSSKRTWRIRAGKRLGGDIAVQLAEIAGGVRIDPATGSVRSVARADRLSQLPQLLQAIGNDNDWRDAVERVLPWSETTAWNHRERVNLGQYVAGLLASGDESAVAEAAILDPANEALPSLIPQQKE